MTDYYRIAKGGHGTVLLDDKTYKLLKKFVRKERHMAKRLDKVLKAYANDGGKFLDDSQMKSEGRFGCGLKQNTKVIVWAMKGYPQARLYGCIDSKDNTLVCLEFDQKKQNKADQEKLKSTAKKFGQYLKEIGNEKSV